MNDDVWRALASALAGSGTDLVDVEVRGGAIVVTVDREGGIDLDALAETTTVVSRVLDELDPMPGHYTLEVTSPGLERRLRTPEHFAHALGETVSVRTHPGTAPVRRVEGRLVAADEASVTLEGDEVPGGALTLAYADIERARTVFSWGAAPAPSPSRGKASKGAGRGPRRSGSDKERVTSP